jgi:hypothetical protein
LGKGKEEEKKTSAGIVTRSSLGRLEKAERGYYGEEAKRK